MDFDLRKLLHRMMSGGSRRDFWKVFGYPDQVSPEEYWRMYRRGGIARRIIRAYPDACWRIPPVIQDEQGSSAVPGADEYSAFTAAWAELESEFGLFSVLSRADRLSRVGHYSIIVIGLADKSDLSTPAPASAELAYLSVYAERSVRITQWDEDPTSPRFGLPVIYSVTMGKSTIGRNRSRSVKIHWTRVIHVADEVDEDEVFGQPALEPVLNHVLDLNKVLGSSAETFWLNARGGISVEVDPNARMDEKKAKELQEKVEDYADQLRRTVAVQGAKLVPMNLSVADPSKHVESHIRAICGTTGIPVRILTGSERGELSSQQDSTSFEARVDERVNLHCYPNILRPFVEALISFGILPEPVGEWKGDWPEATSLSQKEQAEIAERRMNVLDKWASGNADRAIALPEVRMMVGLPPESEYDLEEDGEEDQPDSLGDGLPPIPDDEEDGGDPPVVDDPEDEPNA